MYERHFGITGPPFQLSPDPSFYFDGGQHRAALAVLRQAFSRELPFVVLSGEIGAGKTTVLHTWLAECRSAGIAVAQITNTQLDAAELQCAIAAAFGLDASRRAAARSIRRLAPLLARAERAPGGAVDRRGAEPRPRGPAGPGAAGAGGGRREGQTAHRSGRPAGVAWPRLARAPCRNCMHWSSRHATWARWMPARPGSTSSIAC